MQVNAGTQPVVYIPSQVIAPSVPNDQPISLPTPDRSADPTPNGTPFVSADADRDAASGHGKDASSAKASLAQSLTAQAVAGVPGRPTDRAPDAATSARRAGFDEYA